LRKVAPAKSNPCALTTMGKRRRAGCTARASACQVAIRTARRWWHDCPDISPLAYAIPAFWCPFRLAPKDFPDCAFYLSPDAVSNGRFTSIPAGRNAEIAVMSGRRGERFGASERIPPAAPFMPQAVDRAGACPSRQFSGGPGRKGFRKRRPPDQLDCKKRPLRRRSAAPIRSRC
jgi:hypothetical protein